MVCPTQDLQRIDTGIEHKITMSKSIGIKTSPTITYVFSAIFLSAAVAWASCKVSTASTCGFCPGLCTYVVWCGTGLWGYQTCDGSSNGTLQADCPGGASTGKMACSGFPTLCGAPVTLKGVCCGGARLVSMDKTPVWWSWASGSNCPDTYGTFTPWH